MIKAFLIITVAVTVAAAFFFFMWRLTAGRQKKTKEALGKATEQLKEAALQQAKLESTISILQQNRKEADEKVDDLHSGDSLGNALSELHKPKS